MTDKFEFILANSQTCGMCNITAKLFSARYYQKLLRIRMNWNSRSSQLTITRFRRGYLLQMDMRSTSSRIVGASHERAK